MTDLVLDGPTFTVVGEADLIPIAWDLDHQGVHPHREATPRTYLRWLHLSPGRVAGVTCRPGLNVLWDARYRPKVTLFVRLRRWPRWLEAWIWEPATRPKWLVFDPRDWSINVHLRLWRTVR